MIQTHSSSNIKGLETLECDLGKLVLRYRGLHVPELPFPLVPGKTFALSNSRWVGTTFYEHLIENTFPFHGIPQMTADILYLPEEGTDEHDIMPALGNKLQTKETLLYLCDHLTAQQPEGKEGPLVTDGRSNIIGYLECFDGIRCVRTSFSFGKWCFSAIKLSPYLGGQAIISLRR